MILTKGKAIELLNRSLPYPQHIKNIDLDAADDAIYFDWREFRYKLDIARCGVDRLEGGCLIGDDISILMTQLLKAQIGNVI